MIITKKRTRDKGYMMKTKGVYRKKRNKSKKIGKQRYLRLEKNVVLVQSFHVYAASENYLKEVLGLCQ